MIEEFNSLAHLCQLLKSQPESPAIVTDDEHAKAICLDAGVFAPMSARPTKANQVWKVFDWQGRKCCAVRFWGYRDDEANGWIVTVFPLTATDEYILGCLNDLINDQAPSYSEVMEHHDSVN